MMVRILIEIEGKGGGDSDGKMIEDDENGNENMLRIDNEGEEEWIKNEMDDVGNMRCDDLMSLKEEGKNIEEKRNIRKEEEKELRKIGEVRIEDDRKNVVLEMGEEGNIIKKKNIVVKWELIESG